MTTQNKYYTPASSHSNEVKTTSTILPEQKNVDEIIDRHGNHIILQEITGKMRLAFYRALGSKDSTNQAVILELWPVMAVKSINNEPIGLLDSLVKIETIHARLDDGHATGKIMEWLSEKEIKQAENQQEAKQAIKK